MIALKGNPRSKFRVAISGKDARKHFRCPFPGNECNAFNTFAPVTGLQIERSPSGKRFYLKSYAYPIEEWPDAYGVTIEEPTLYYIYILPNNGCLYHRDKSLWNLRTAKRYASTFKATHGKDCEVWSETTPPMRVFSTAC